MVKTKKVRSIYAVLLSVIMVLFLGVPVFAAQGNAKEIFYTVYNEKGEVMEEGVIPVSNARVNWSPDITLDNGWYTGFRQEGGRAFYAMNNTEMSFSYTLDRSAKIKYQFMKADVAETAYAEVWKTGTKTAKSGTINQTADKSAYYYVGITNVSSDPITIKSVSFTF